MIIVDLNLLVYAVNSDAAFHDKARIWLEKQMNGSESIGIPWIVLLGFLRIMTNGKVFPLPLTPEQSITIIDRWLSNPLVTMPEPKAKHWNLVRELLLETGMAGNLTSDVHLAAIAIGHGAKIISLDADFSRFRGLRWEKPF